VRAIDQTIEEKNGVRTVVAKTATLEVTPQQAETLALARKLGTVSLSLRSLVDSNGSSPGPVVPVAPDASPGEDVVVYRGVLPNSYKCAAKCVANGTRSGAGSDPAAPDRP
jgi:Flp pilus assembly protein CpaB